MRDFYHSKHANNMITTQFIIHKLVNQYVHTYKMIGPRAQSPSPPSSIPKLLKILKDKNYKRKKQEEEDNDGDCALGPIILYV